MQEQKKRKCLKVNFDMIKSDKEYYLENCNFTENQEKIFLDLTDKKQYSRVQIAERHNMSVDNVDKIIRKIKLKMLATLLVK